MTDLQKRIDAITPEITAMREYIHEHPELSMQEFCTARRIEEELVH